jgi:hypothetical protein
MSNSLIKEITIYRGPKPGVKLPPSDLPPYKRRFGKAPVKKFTDQFR